MKSFLGTFCGFWLCFLVGCAVPPPRAEIQPVFSAYRAVSDESDADGGQIKEFLDSIEKSEKQRLQLEARLAIARRLERRRVQDVVHDRLREAAEKQGETHLAKTREHLRNFELKNAEAELEYGRKYLPDHEEMKSLAERLERLKLARAHQRMGIAPGAVSDERTGQVLQGHLDAAQIHLGLGRRPEARGHLLDALKLVQARRAEAARRRALNKLGDRVQGEMATILESIENDSFDEGGRALASVLQEFDQVDGRKENRDFWDQDLGLSSGEFAELLEAIEAGDFEKAEMLIARRGASSPVARSLYERVQRLKQSLSSP